MSQRFFNHPQRLLCDPVAAMGVPSGERQVYIAFDYGTAWTGVAVGQTITNTAMPLAPLRMARGRTDAAQLNVLVSEWQPTGFVLGLPAAPVATDATDATGRLNIARRVRSFADYLSRRYARQCYFVDERLSSRSLQDVRATKRKAKDLPPDKASSDSRVAQALLCQWLQNKQQARSSKTT